MGALGATYVTLADVAKSKNKQVGKVAEVLVKTNRALNDIPYYPMNEGTIHKEDIRSGLPEVYYRKANEAIPASKTTTEERTFSAAHFESKSQMDEMVAKRGGTDRINYNRWNQAQGHIQAMGQEHGSLLIYGSPLNDARKTPGLADVYSTLSASVETSKQIVNAGGVGSDNTSIFLVGWGEMSIFGIYPAGTTSGLKRTDRNRGGALVPIPMLDSAGNPGTVWGYEEQFEIDHGLVVKDYRQGARVANIDVSELIAGNVDLIDLMISALYKVDSLENGTFVFYVNRTVEAALDKLALTKVGAGAGITYDNYQGSPVLMFRKIPVRRMDAILDTEAAVA